MRWGAAFQHFIKAVHTFAHTHTDVRVNQSWTDCMKELDTPPVMLSDVPPLNSMLVGDDSAQPWLVQPCVSGLESSWNTPTLAQVPQLASKGGSVYPMILAKVSYVAMETTSDTRTFLKKCE